MTDVASWVEISQLEAEYARCWATGDADAWAALFTDSGVFELQTTGDIRGERAEGRGALHAFCRKVTAQWHGVYVTSPPSIRIDGDTAAASVPFLFRYLNRFQDVTDVGMVTGIDTVRYARHDGHWLIQERIETAISRTSNSWFDGFFKSRPPT